MLSVGSFSAVLGKLVETQIPGPACNLMSSLAPGGFFFCTTFPVFSESVTLLLCFMVRFSGREACTTLAPHLGVRRAPSAPEGEVSTTRPPGKSPRTFVFHKQPYF